MRSPHAAGRWITSDFDAVRIISLPTRKDRRRDMTRQLARIGLLPGRDNVAFFDAIRCTDKGEWPTLGARGCFLSHMTALKDARAAGARSVLLIEDDADFGPALLKAEDGVLEAIGAASWDVLYGGRQVADLRSRQPGLRVLDPSEHIVGAHFVAMRGAALDAVVPHLEALASRRRGDPLGGPMHVDGAYSRMREANPDLRSVLVEPDLAYQRSSRTDIHDLRMHDRIPLVSTAIAVARCLRNRVRSL